MICIAITSLGFVYDRPVLFFNIAYLILALSLFTLEKFIPHADEWNHDDGQTFANLAHTFSSKGLVQTIVIFSGTIGLQSLIVPAAQATGNIWPYHWPMAVQVMMGLTLAEFGLYWAHRLAHTYYPLWRFHAVHHSVTRLWFLNTGRFHFIDSLISIILAMIPLLVLGAPMEVVVWISAITAFIGLLTHCNVQMRCGVLNWIFATPELHHWHHSREIPEGDSNFGQNLMIWDIVFKSFYFPKHRIAPVNIGIKEYMPPGFLAQLAWPFRNFKKPTSI